MNGRTNDSKTNIFTIETIGVASGRSLLSAKGISVLLPMTDFVDSI